MTMPGKKGVRRYDTFYYCRRHGWVPKSTALDTPHGLCCPVDVGGYPCMLDLRTRKTHSDNA